MRTRQHHVRTLQAFVTIVLFALVALSCRGGTATADDGGMPIAKVGDGPVGDAESTQAAQEDNESGVEPTEDIEPARPKINYDAVYTPGILVIVQSDQLFDCYATVTATDGDYSETLPRQATCVYWGVLHRPGTYTLTVSEQGYEPETVSGVVVEPSADGGTGRIGVVKVVLPTRKRWRPHNLAGMQAPVCDRYGVYDCWYRCRDATTGIERCVTPRVVVGETVVVGAALAQAKRVMRGVHLMLLNCYQEAVLVVPELEGEITVIFELPSPEFVPQVWSTLFLPESFRSCVRDNLKLLHADPMLERSAVTVPVTLRLESSILRPE